MTRRLTDRSAAMGAIQQLQNVERYVHSTGLDHRLLELVKMRVSQVNGCAFCLAMHAKALREAGEREDRIAVLPAWRETDWFSDKERAALAWAEAVTTLEHQHVPDDVYEQARAQFDERDLADLTLATIAINGWNRLNIALTQSEPTPFTMDAEVEAAD
jgi:AhpD family alkylhydroperoxidase